VRNLSEPSFIAPRLPRTLCPSPESCRPPSAMERLLRRLSRLPEPLYMFASFPAPRRRKPHPKLWPVARDRASLASFRRSAAVRRRAPRPPVPPPPRSRMWTTLAIRSLAGGPD
jgi:hypothetical protein